MRTPPSTSLYMRTPPSTKKRLYKLGRACRSSTRDMPPKGSGAAANKRRKSAVFGKRAKKSKKATDTPASDGHASESEDDVPPPPAIPTSPSGGEAADSAATSAIVGGQAPDAAAPTSEIVEGQSQDTTASTSQVVGGQAPDAAAPTSEIVAAPPPVTDDDHSVAASTQEVADSVDPSQATPQPASATVTITSRHSKKKQVAKLIVTPDLTVVNASIAEPAPVGGDVDMTDAASTSPLLGSSPVQKPNNGGAPASIAAPTLRATSPILASDEDDEANDVGASSSVAPTSSRPTSGGKFYARMQAERVQASSSPENGKAPADEDEAGAGASSTTVPKPKKKDLVTGHGKGKGGAKRHRKIVRPAIEGMSNNEIRRLARRAGVKRIGGGVYEEVRKMTQNFLDDVLFKTLIHVEHQKKKTVAPHDVVAGFKCMGGTVYGFGN